MRAGLCRLEIVAFGAFQRGSIEHRRAAHPGPDGTKEFRGAAIDLRPDRPRPIATQLAGGGIDHFGVEALTLGPVALGAFLDE